MPDGDKLWDSVTRETPLGEVRFTLPKGRGQSAREVVQEVWAKKVTLPDGKKDVVQAYCIVAREITPPEGEKPVEWRLLTNLSVETREHATKMIDWYRSRWEIEMLFHVFNHGGERILNNGYITVNQKNVITFVFGVTINKIYSCISTP